MSALLLKADVCRANRHVGFGPKANIASASIPLTQSAGLFAKQNSQLTQAQSRVVA